MLTAYSQSVATERPELARLAQRQKVSPSALRHRYNALHVQAVRELLRDDPIIDVVLEPFSSVTEDDLRGISDVLDVQLDLRKRMRAAVSEEFNALLSNRQAKAFNLKADPSDHRAIRLISDLGPALDLALERRAPELLPTFTDWQTGFEARDVKTDDVKATATRIRRN